jgi:creatinine amidohydrolase
MRIDLAERTAEEVAAADADHAVLPVGSTEQHGPHAPLGTDTFHAESIAAAGAERFAGPVAVAPPIPVGVSAEHRSFAGTLWVSPDSFRRYVGDVLDSLLEQGFGTVVVVNGHGGNVGPLREITARKTRENGARVVPFTWFDALDEPDMGHGGPVETALLRYTHPDLVREGETEAAAADAAERWGEWVAGVNVAYDTEAFSENGVVGDPREGDAERGARLLERGGTALADVLGAL